MIPLIGYSDRLSVAPGMTINFQVSSSGQQPYQAKLVRVICGDPNPNSPGILEEELPASFTGSYPSRTQPVYLGSYGRIIDNQEIFHQLDSFTLITTIFPTTPDKGEQGIISKFDRDNQAGFALFIDSDGCVAACLGDGQKNYSRVTSSKKLKERTWYRLWATYQGEQKLLSVGVSRLESAYPLEDTVFASTQIDFFPQLKANNPLLIAALGGTPVQGYFNGKIERPTILSRAINNKDKIEEIATKGTSNDLVAAWDFSQDIQGTRIIDLGTNQLDGELINLPTRGVKGSNWSGEEMCWRHAPEQYGAIHFHDDDIYDCGWETDFSFTVPENMRSGVYAARLQYGDLEDMIPFFVVPKLDQPQSDLCVLIPTFTYIMYGNHARGNTNEVYRQRATAWKARPWTPDEHSEYGLSTYNFHSDGSGICYASRLRPIMNMRSGFISIPEFPGSGLRHFPADTHLFDWLEAMGHNFDVITDEDLHDNGVSSIAPYKVVLTTTHPEYQTKETLDALQSYIACGGRLMYLGGNGFYWRIAAHHERDGVYEIRRAEGGIRAWAAEPGEYYHSFDGTYGGLWRNNARPPQELVGVGFSAQGFMEGTFYRRLINAKDPRCAWLFEGVDDEILGNFGLIGGGAAGYELDRVDYSLGTPLHALILASSEAHSENFILVHEEQLTHISNRSGELASKLIRADMVYYEAPLDGAVFSVGSITFAGSLSHNNYNNNISQITNNVLNHFITTSKK